MAEIYWWPKSLGCPQQSGYSETTPSTAVIKTSMQSGPQKMRRRVSYSPRQVSMKLILRGAGVQTLDGFYWTTLNEVGNFYWPDYRKPLHQDNVAVYRFVEPPSYDSIGPRLWTANLQLERMTMVNGHFLLNIREEDSYLST